jgi:hypothetical protein
MPGLGPGTHELLPADSGQRNKRTLPSHGPERVDVRAGRGHDGLFGPYPVVNRAKAAATLR